MRDDIKLNDRAKALSQDLVEKLETVYDPEIELDIYNLGLIYEITIDEKGHCQVVMTFTDVACGCADTLPLDLAEVLKTIDGIESASVKVVWKPVWKLTRISRLGRIALGISPR
ncbi:metal-sulfur cluster assembly factor [Streptococcus downei]|uniref:Aromatic ring hydroxylating enzyme, evidenced by COGnitor PaaD-like protein involved in Fe-S cluster assembly n=1 Tax=Streptococcus downei MFe28 TaxID=764290 RepID=A0A380JG10_STRDO|nr:metal-sulfur cluster assembly factor [Streptococcus downei]EFQ57783.1 hypothetical protein HMPREF9176_1950 [Streptococcus downei F0415]SUN36842.1 aromatic ring hydroxylating enzyme, evidenced by COGnitor; PaaD-like protein involved in Fe-S cluster assembly [Streptococcus downei MFe28]